MQHPIQRNVPKPTVFSERARRPANTVTHPRPLPIPPTCYRPEEGNRLKKKSQLIYRPAEMKDLPEIVKLLGREDSVMVRKSKEVYGWITNGNLLVAIQEEEDEPVRGLIRIAFVYDEKEFLEVVAEFQLSAQISPHSVTTSNFFQNYNIQQMIDGEIHMDMERLSILHVSTLYVHPQERSGRTAVRLIESGISHYIPTLKFLRQSSETLLNSTKNRLSSGMQLEEKASGAIALVFGTAAHDDIVFRIASRNWQRAVQIAWGRQFPTQFIAYPSIRPDGQPSRANILLTEI